MKLPGIRTIVLPLAAAILFSAGLLMVIFRMSISRFLSDVAALLVGGGLLAAVPGAGILIERYRNKQ